MMQLLMMRPGRLTKAVAELDPETLLTDVQAAVLLGLQPSTLVTWRHRSLGPRFRRIGQGRKRTIRYTLSDVLAYRDRDIVTPRKEA